MRTDPDAPKHKGLSVFMVPLDAPRVTVQPILTWGGIRTNAVHFNDVRVDADALIGAENDGWRYVTTALDFERVSIGVTGGLRRLYDETLRCVASLDIDVRHQLAEMSAQIELARLLNYRAAWMVDQGMMPNRTPYSAPSSEGAASAWSYLTPPPCSVSASSLSARAASGAISRAAATSKILFMLFSRWVWAQRFRARSAPVVKTVGLQRRHGLPGCPLGGGEPRAGRGARG